MPTSDFHYTDTIKALVEESLKTATNFHSWTCPARIILVMLLRVGFVLVQVGSVPVNNVNSILLENIIDICWVTAVYILIGYIIAYNGDVEGLIGEGYWIGHVEVDKDEAIIGWSAVVIASAICTCAIGGRTHTIGYLVIGFLLSAIVQPFLIHWVWTPNGWMNQNQLNGKRVIFRDYAGSGIIHLVGGLSGLIGCITLGRRLLRLKDIDEASVPIGSSANVCIGQLLVFIGLQSLSVPNLDRDKSKMSGNGLSHLYVNNLLAASSCSLLVAALHFILSAERFNHSTVMRCVEATVAGLVTISAGTNVYSPQIAIGLGCVGGLIFYLVSRQVFRSALEDYCNTTAIHLACAILGSTLAPLCAYEEDTDITLTLLNFSWQLICLIIVSCFVTLVMALTFVVLQFFGVLRNRSEHLNHLRAITAMRKAPKTSYMQRLFPLDNGSVYLQPGSLSNSGEKPSADSRFQQRKVEADNLGGSRSCEMNHAETKVDSKRNEV